jgi:hypothetical protein
MPIGETDVGIILSKKTNRIGIASMMVGSRPMKAACAYRLQDQTVGLIRHQEKEMLKGNGCLLKRVSLISDLHKKAKKAKKKGAKPWIEHGTSCS